MKTAIICDWLVTVGGAEKVLNQLLTCYPDADVYSVIDFLEDRSLIHHKPVTTTFVQKLPFARKRYRSYLPLMPLAIEQFDLSQYDLIISSSHAVAKGVLTGPDQIHICYIHSPMRYAWDLQHQYLRETNLDKKPLGYLARYFLHKLRMWDLRSANGVDHFIANSDFIRRRVLKTYRRDAAVIYPPIDTQRFVPGNKKADFYLCASRMVPYKKMDLIVESFKQMPEKKLVVIGDGPEFEKIKAKAGSNVRLLGFRDNETLVSYMQEAKALIFAAEEDFGLIPLEAQACGTPVIAYGKGGALETVCGLDSDKPTGVFFPRQTVEAVVAAVHLYETNAARITMENCVEHAARFSPENFRKTFTSFIQKKMAVT